MKQLEIEIDREDVWVRIAGVAEMHVEDTAPRYAELKTDLEQIGKHVAGVFYRYPEYAEYLTGEQNAV